MLTTSRREVDTIIIQNVDDSSTRICSRENFWWRYTIRSCEFPRTADAIQCIGVHSVSWFLHTAREDTNDFPIVSRLDGHIHSGLNPHWNSRFLFCLLFLGEFNGGRWWNLLDIETDVDTLGISKGISSHWNYLAINCQYEFNLTINRKNSFIQCRKRHVLPFLEFDGIPISTSRN